MRFEPVERALNGPESCSERDGDGCGKRTLSDVWFYLAHCAECKLTRLNRASKISLSQQHYPGKSTHRVEQVVWSSPRPTSLSHRSHTLKRAGEGLVGMTATLTPRRRARRTPPAPTNVLVLVLPALLFSPGLLPLFHAHFASYGTLHAWTPLEKFGRVICVYDDEGEARRARDEMDGFVWEDAGEEGLPDGHE